MTLTVKSLLRSKVTGAARRAVLPTAVLLAVAVTLTGCGGDDHPSSAPSSGSSGSTSSSGGATSSPSASASVPGGTAPGTKLSFGDTATVPYRVGKQDGVLALTVRSATKGTLADFKGFDMSDPYKRKGSYYYVRVSVRNAGKHPLGGMPVPLWGISDKGVLLHAVDFNSAFTRCPTEDLPKTFKPKAKLDTCLVYLSPNHGGLDGVSYRPTVDYLPVEWHGKVQTPSQGTGKGGGNGTGGAKQ